MIIVRLVGGLGNQMFQYAMGRSLALRKNTELKLDKSWLGKKFSTGTYREYMLDVRNIQENFATAEELKRVKNGDNGIAARFLLWILGKEFPVFKIKQIKNYLVARLLGKETPFYAQPVVNERFYYVFDPDILKVNKDVYLQGYWNNEKYFKDIKDTIRKEFEVKTPPTKENQAMLEKIKDCNAVSIHIRRSDYVTDPVTKKLHNTFNMDYYQKAVKIIASRVGDPHFFAFSDDIAWVKKNLKIKYPITYVDYNDIPHGYEDMRLMSSCKHNIIANSSFSWWGAWLNPNPDKIVIAPLKWLNDPNIDTSDVTPKSWIRI